MKETIDPQTLAKANLWLTGNYDAETKAAVQDLLDNNPQEIIESFYRDLEFGTGGLRGIMGVGSNRMNKYTVGAATQGFSNYLKATNAHITSKGQILHMTRIIPNA